VKDTLETLGLSVGRPSKVYDRSSLGGDQNGTIGSLCEFERLKRLTIEDHVLLGSEDSWCLEKGIEKLQ